MIGGPNEQAVLRFFADFRRQSGGDEEEDDLAEESDEDYTPRRRYSYPREYKLAGIEYFQTTWMKLKDETLARITVGKAARKLKITRKMLRHWVKNKGKILNQKKGSRRAREPWQKGQEYEMEIELNKLFEAARDEGRNISHKWILRHAKEIYRKLHPECAIQGKDGR
jgi:hypothetical protein